MVERCRCDLDRLVRAVGDRDEITVTTVSSGIIFPMLPKMSGIYVSKLMLRTGSFVILLATVSAKLLWLRDLERKDPSTYKSGGRGEVSGRTWYRMIMACMVNSRFLFIRLGTIGR